MSSKIPKLMCRICEETSSSMLESITTAQNLNLTTKYMACANVKVYVSKNVYVLK